MGADGALTSYGKMKCKCLPSGFNIPHILRFVIEWKRSEKGLILRCKIPLIPKNRAAHTRLILICSKNGMKKQAQKTAVPNKVRFGIAVVRFCSFVLSAAQKARLKKFMLRKGQHRQVAPLAIQTPTKGGLCIGCAVLPAQRGHPLRDLPEAT